MSSASPSPNPSPVTRPGIKPAFAKSDVQMAATPKLMIGDVKMGLSIDVKKPAVGGVEVQNSGGMPRILGSVVIEAKAETAGGNEGLETVVDESGKSEEEKKDESVKI
jgi:hypothetical protein